VIDDCLAIFERQGDIDKLVLDTYVPADGTYIIVKYIDGKFVLPDKPYEVKQDKKTRELSISHDEQMMISRMDYYCRLIDMNKPVDGKKIIQSNNYLSFFIKKESLTNGKLTDECIEKYYQILKNPYLKYTKKQDMVLYKSVEDEVGTVNADRVDLVCEWIKNNIFSLPYEIKGKDYLKIFFVFEDGDFEAEGKRYYVPNVYNKNDYNIVVENVVYGLPNNNMGLNAKKPYLEHKNRKSKMPLMEDTNKVMLKKKFFDYLMNNASSGCYNIYFPIADGEAIRPVDGKKIHCNFEGYYMRIRKDKNEAAIIEHDTVAVRHDKLRSLFEMQNILEIPEKECEETFYGKTQEMTQIFGSVDQIFFSKYLANNMFNDVQDISAPDEKIKKALILYRNAYKNWFYMGYDDDMEAVVRGTADIAIQNSIDNNYRKVNHQFNLKWSLIEYFRQGDEKMADILKRQRDSIRQKINTDRDVYVSIDNDEEYCYAVGQLVKYFLGLSKAGKKTYSLANPYFNTREDKLLKERLKSLFLKYNYSEDMSGKRFEKLYGMICSYEVETGLNQDIMIAGFISPNLIYEKGDK
jgi:CRISPR-associated protein Csh1